MTDANIAAAIESVTSREPNGNSAAPTGAGDESLQTFSVEARAGGAENPARAAKRGLASKTVAQHVKEAEEMARENFDFLPNEMWLRANGYDDLAECMQAKPDAFLHIRRMSLASRIAPNVESRSLPRSRSAREGARAAVERL